MSISKKIMDEIDSLKIEEKEKELIKKFLETEDSGNYRYKNKYDQIVDEYIKNENTEVK